MRTHSQLAGQDIAVKVFTHAAPEEWTRFQQEVRNAQALASPTIVRTYSPFRRGGLAWIELELVEGEDLRRALERRARGGPAVLPRARRWPSPGPSPTRSNRTRRRGSCTAT